MDKDIIQKYLTSGYEDQKEIIDNSEIELSYKIMKFLEEVYILEIGKVDEFDIRIKNAIIAITNQIILSYKSCVLLCINGYYISALTVLRTIAELLITLEDIMIDETCSIKKANNFRQGKKNGSISEKAKQSFNSPLYSIYKILCEFSHGNMKAINQNTKENIFFSYPTSETESFEKITNVLSLSNALIIYLLDELYRKVIKNKFDVFDMTENSRQFLEYFHSELEKVNVIFEAFKTCGFTDEQISELKNDLHKFRKNKSVNKKNNRKKNIVK